MLFSFDNLLFGFLLVCENFYAAVTSGWKRASRRFKVTQESAESHSVFHCKKISSQNNSVKHFEACLFVQLNRLITLLSNLPGRFACRRDLKNRSQLANRQAQTRHVHTLSTAFSFFPTVQNHFLSVTSAYRRGQVEHT